MKKLTTIIILTIAALLIGWNQTASATEYYIFPSDSIQEAVDVMQPGDVLYLHGGTYNEIGIFLGENFHHGSPEQWYTISSYPGEWAIIDGQHNPASENWRDSCIFSASDNKGQMGYIAFENIEITGAGYDVDDPRYPCNHGAAIKMRGGPFRFENLYIHHNYGKDNNNSAGLQLEGGTCNTLIENCHFKANGQVKNDPEEPGVRTTSSANLMIFADYEYSDTVTLYNDKGYCTATFGNEVRYNLFEADATDVCEDCFTTTGFKHKGMQRLTGMGGADQQIVDRVIGTNSGERSRNTAVDSENRDLLSLGITSGVAVNNVTEGTNTFVNSVDESVMHTSSLRGNEDIIYYWNPGDNWSVTDNAPNGREFEALGDKIHHNIFLDHMVGILVDQDYTQVYNNILFLKDWEEGPDNAIQGRDASCTRRGPFKFTVYNNSINADGLYAILHHPVP